MGSPRCPRESQQSSPGLLHSGHRGAPHQLGHRWAGYRDKAMDELGLDEERRTRAGLEATEGNSEGTLWGDTSRRTYGCIPRSEG